MSACLSKLSQSAVLHHRSPDQAVEHRGVTVMVTSTGLDSFPPQSVATTERTWDLDSLSENNNQKAGKDQDHELDLKHISSRKKLLSKSLTRISVFELDKINNFDLPIFEFRDCF